MSVAPLRDAPVLTHTIARLRAMALAAQEGDFLGSEQELQDLLGVSRPTFRQAVRILERDQLLVKRMGMHGGCYASRPDLQSVARSASLFLQIEQTKLHHLMDVAVGLKQQVVAAACLCTDEASRQALEGFLKNVSQDRTPPDEEWFLAGERAFELHLVAMAGNPALSLFLRIARKFVDDNPASHVLITNPAMRRMRIRAWASLGEAVLAGDVERGTNLVVQQHNAALALIPQHVLRRDGIGEEPEQQLTRRSNVGT